MSVKWTKSGVESKATDGWPRLGEVSTSKTPKSGDDELYKRVTSVFEAVIGVVVGVVAAAGIAAPMPATTKSEATSPPGMLRRVIEVFHVRHCTCVDNVHGSF
jgi:hypothetical protein